MRGAPGVRSAFSQLWHTEDLLCSFDNISLFRPWTMHPEWRTVGGWWHTDPPAPGEYVQGAVNLYDVTAETGGTVVRPRSHLEYSKAEGSGTPAWARAMVPTCASGDMILW